MESQTDFVVINIGRNTANGQLDRLAWIEYQNEIGFLIEFNGKSVGYGIGNSEWDGKGEQFATFHALIPSDKHEHVKNLLAGLAKSYSQDAIAYIVSTDAALVKAI